MSTRATVREAVISTAESLGFSIKKEQLETIENFVLGRDVFQCCLLDLGKVCAIGVFLESTTNFVFRTVVTSLLL